MYLPGECYIDNLTLANLGQMFLGLRDLGKHPMRKTILLSRMIHSLLMMVMICSASGGEQ